MLFITQSDAIILKVHWCVYAEFFITIAQIEFVSKPYILLYLTISPSIHSWPPCIEIPSIIGNNKE